MTLRAVDVAWYDARFIDHVSLDINRDVSGARPMVKSSKHDGGTVHFLWKPPSEGPFKVTVRLSTSNWKVGSVKLTASRTGAAPDWWKDLRWLDAPPASRT